MSKIEVQRYVFFSTKKVKQRKCKKTETKHIVNQKVVKKKNKNGKKFFSLNKI